MDPHRFRRKLNGEVGRAANLRRRGWDEAQAHGDPIGVGVYRADIAPEAVGHNTCGSLKANARQRGQVAPVHGGLALVVF